MKQMESDSSEAIVSKLLEESGYSREKLQEEVDKKKAEYDMLTDEGALTLIANELGISLGDEESEVPSMMIADLKPGMRDIDIIGKVVRIYPPREFTRRDGSKGSVCSIILSDETGSVRLTLWDRECRTLDEVKEQDIIRIVGGICKSGRSGNEIHTARRARLMLNPSVSEDPRVAGLESVTEYVEAPARRRKITELDVGDSNVEVRATVVRLYRIWVYDACPKCGRKVVDGSCSSCGEVSPEPRSILDIGIDDSMGFLRAKLFGDVAEELLGASPFESRRSMGALIERGFDDRRASQEYLSREHQDLLGSEMIFRGRVDSDEYRGLVLSISGIGEPDPVEETRRVLEEVEA